MGAGFDGIILMTLSDP